MRKIDVPVVINPQTAEVIPFYLAKKQDILSYLSTLSNSDKSIKLTEVNAFKKFLILFESVLKEWIKDNIELEFDDKGKAIFEGWKLSKVYRKSFDKDKFERDATKEERQIMDKYNEIQKKYIKMNSYIKF